MRKFMYAASFVLTAAASTVAAAQGTQQKDRPRAERAEGRAEGRGRGPGGFLLKGINLTDAQKSQLKALREKQGGKQDREAMRKQFEDARAAAQKGDSSKFAALRTQMEARRAQQNAAIRAILTPDQQKQFDANVAEMKTRMAQGGQRGQGRGWGKKS